jgi:hypothetical protein
MCISVLNFPRISSPIFEVFMFDYGSFVF